MEHRPVAEVRFLKKRTGTVLQQKWLDGWDNPYWKDVPTVIED